MSEAIPDLNFGDLFDAVARLVPDRPAIAFGDRTISWRELDGRSNRLARYLIDLGLQPGSKVAFYLRNSPAYVELFFACAKARLTHANVNYRYVDEELWYLLDNADAEVVVFDAEYAGHAGALKDRLPKVRTWLAVSATGADIPAFASSFEAACRDGDASPLELPRSGDDLYFMYTGGTTGYPKAVMWPHKDRIAVIGMARAGNAADHAAIVAAESGPVALPAAPLMHSTGLTTLMSTLCAGGCVVLLTGRSFDAAECVAAIERHRVQRVAIVGDAFSVPLLTYLHAHPNEHDLTSVGLVSSAGAMWSEQFKQGLLEYFPNAVLSDSLGSSEGSRMGAITTRRGEQTKTARFEVGPNVKVFTEDFREVQPGSGEAGMLAKGGPLPLGYYKDPERTAKTFPVVNGERYSLAGDWCRIEADGTMTLLGRGNNCINTGGEKVYPEEVEDALKQIPDVADAAVLGVPDERFGSAVAALIRRTADSGVDEAAISDHLGTRLARYKHPRIMRFVATDFRHANGKINYREARRILEETMNP